jgi:AcrR family transcriptional regulator
MTTAAGYQVTNTRERIIVEAVRLFAAHGYRGVSVAQIEAAAGLSPGSGGLYRHFPSKEDVLAAGLERYVTRIEALLTGIDLVPGDDLRVQLTTFARATLAGMRAEADFIRILVKEIDRFPDLFATVRERLLYGGYRQMAAWLGRRAHGSGLRAQDWDAVAAVGLGALINFQVSDSVFGTRPGDVDEDRFVSTWVDLMLSMVQGAPAPPAPVAPGKDVHR